MAAKKILDYKNGKFVFNYQNIPTTIAEDSEMGSKELGIISIIGEQGSGKSFLQNAIVNYLQIGQTSFSDEESLLQVFPLETSSDPETSGIDVYENYIWYDPERSGKCPHYVSVWDTEGSLDPHQDENKIPAILGMTAFCSSVTIYNVKDKLDSNNMGNMQELLKKLRDSWKEALDKQFQDLVIVIRNLDDDRFNFGFEGGDEYKKFHLSKDGVGKIKPFFEELELVFRSVRIFLMPEPNTNVRKRAKNHSRKMSDIDELFRSSLQTFCDVIVGELLEPRKFEDDFLTINNLYSMMSQFREDFVSPGQILNNAMQGRIFESITQTSLKTYQENCISKFRAFFSVVATRRKKHEEIKKLVISEAEKKIKVKNFGNLKTKSLLAGLAQILEKQYETAEDDLANKREITFLSIGGFVITGVAVVFVLVAPSLAKKLLPSLLCGILGRIFANLRKGKNETHTRDGVTTIARYFPD